MNEQLAATLIATSLLLSTLGCEKGFQGQTYSKTPSVVSDELLVVGVSNDEISELMADNPQAKTRVLSKRAYGFTGLTKRQILEAAPGAIVERNELIPLQSLRPLDRKELLSKKFHKTLQKGSGFEAFSPDNCSENALLRVPEITVANKQKDLAPVFNVGDDLTLFFEEPSSPGLAAWHISPPMGSKLKIQFESDNELQFSPDMPGLYGVALFFKKRGLCNVKLIQIVVSSNETYNPILSKEDKAALKKLSKREFKQVTSTRAHTAQILLDESSPEVVVAVLDSGVNYNHPALKKNIWTNTKEIPGDLIDNDNNGYVDDVIGYDFEGNDPFPMDELGHGSHVAGLVAGRFMGTGDLPNIKIMAIKATSKGDFTLSSLIQGIDYAVDNGAHIINMSLGSNRGHKILELSIAHASEKGVLVVAASGNGDYLGRGMNNDLYPQYPASYELSNVLSVGAVTAEGALTRYSNYGQSSVDITALGGHSGFSNRSTNQLSSAYISNPSGILTQPMSGTSMATPVVSGIAALLLTQDPSLRPTEIREILMATGKRSSALQGVILSESVIDAEKALLSL